MSNPTDCKFRYKLMKFDYSHGGCEHSEPGGFICMAFENDGEAVWMVGTNGCFCECYTPKEGKI